MFICSSVVGAVTAAWSGTTAVPTTQNERVANASMHLQKQRDHIIRCLCAIECAEEELCAALSRLRLGATIAMRTGSFAARSQEVVHLVSSFIVPRDVHCV